MSDERSDLFPAVRFPLLPVNRMTLVGQLAHHFLNTADWSVMGPLKDALIECCRERDWDAFVRSVLYDSGVVSRGHLIMFRHPMNEANRWLEISVGVAKFFVLDLIDLEAWFAQQAKELNPTAIICSREASRRLREQDARNEESGFPVPPNMAGELFPLLRMDANGEVQREETPPTNAVGDDGAGG